MRTLVIAEEIKLSLKNSFKNLTNPYRDYLQFKNDVKNSVSEKVKEYFRNELGELKNDKNNIVVYLKNCPIDDVVPVYDHYDPLNSKYELKKTFVGEGFIEYFSDFMDFPLLGYTTRNNGDFFHDVYSHQKYTETQTQKTDKELYFHNDRTAHEVRADYLLLLGMRCAEENEVVTSYISGIDILNFLTTEEKAILREPYFYTPFDEYSRDSNDSQIDSEPHCILLNDHSFRYYDTRTKPMENSSVEARDAFISLKDAITRSKKLTVKIQTGELFCFPNLDGLHSRELRIVRDEELAKERYLLKSYNFKDLPEATQFDNMYQKDILGLVVD